MKLEECERRRTFEPVPVHHAIIANTVFVIPVCLPVVGTTLTLYIRYRQSLNPGSKPATASLYFVHTSAVKGPVKPW